MWGVNSRDIEVGPECREDPGVHFEGCREWQLGCKWGVGAGRCDKGVEEECPGVRVGGGNR